MNNERIVQLRRLSFCRQLPDDVVRTLALISRLRSYPTGALIVLAGEPPQAMYAIVAGRVKLTRIAPNGREQIINVMGPGQHFNAVPIFDEGPCPVNVEAITDVEVLELPITAMRQVLADHPALAMALLREFAGRLRHMVNLIDNIALHSVQGRLAQLLLSRATASEKGELVAPLTQAEMAAMIGTVREMVSRTLHQFELQGYIRIERGAITICNRTALESCAEA
ncbi:Crp/Fnr family transcriptional regulator [Chloroflexus sp. Y-396-1]|uniref:Crp/Fnr family transcriptional regulator n=1 Tax=Chloroflexus sp. Y-396-1 TaxID=867845 RepID=UPI00048DA797|nr:Crp/Fnr family transcriptional regulator [Chloroflexus sp. Y-396-1]